MRSQNLVVCAAHVSVRDSGLWMRSAEGMLVGGGKPKSAVLLVAAGLAVHGNIYLTSSGKVRPRKFWAGLFISLFGTRSQTG